MHKEHPEFKTDRTQNMALWRYLDLWKFLDLLNSSRLFFPNIEMLGDQHEGRIPEKVYKMMVEQEKQVGATNNFASKYKYFIDNNLRNKTFTCSWIASENESFAMCKCIPKIN